MNIGERMKSIREAKQLKQYAVASEMKTTQQAYQCLETGRSPKFFSLLHFCKVMDIRMEFLVSDIPVSKETIEEFGNAKYSDIAKELSDKKILVKELLHEVRTGNKPVSS